MSRIIKAHQSEPGVLVVVGVNSSPKGIAEEELEQETPRLAEDMEELLVYGRPKAQQIMGLARERAQRLVEQAEAQVDEMWTKAHNEGYSQGYQEGLAEGKKAGEEAAQAQMAPEIAKLAQLADQALDFRAQAMEDCEPQLVELAVKIAKKVVSQELVVRPELVAQLATEAIRELNTPEAVVIRVHPEDAPILEEYWALGSGNYIPSREWQIRPDGSIPAGGCIIEAESSQLDARLETKLSRIAEAFQGVLADTQSDESDEEETQSDRPE